ncbi:MAG: hypothetical protein QOI21_5945 [Actinomycetota bacterium]|jgi:hypothetical protein|nr:hypothetical protein [Actinomycetota bacterium]
MECASCVADLDHCHGTLVVHPDGVVECTEIACFDVDGERHALTIDCESIMGGCQCTVTVEVELLQHAS